MSLMIGSYISCWKQQAQIQSHNKKRLLIACSQRASRHWVISLLVHVKQDEPRPAIFFRRDAQAEMKMIAFIVQFHLTLVLIDCNKEQLYMVACFVFWIMFLMIGSRVSCWKHQAQTQLWEPTAPGSPKGYWSVCLVRATSFGCIFCLGPRHSIAIV